MIFSKKIYKLASGKNLTLFDISSDEFEVFVFENATNKYSMKISTNTKTIREATGLGFNQITKLNSNHSVLCHDKNLTIIENEKQNI